ncbi:hypothetical protein [Nocardioides sp.]|uniref:hypothetical protein n=1 Tax=Nocardioides sp. TaxID=35761 RepID=UPI001A264C1B|nr:hypothetical protein [Nocardioides sp.]MBJ7356216.1 hypothetical protein [Nocardioides sp.]
MTRTIEQLERDLRQPPAELVTAPVLAEIRSRGRARRRNRLAAYAGGAAAGIVAAGLLVGVVVDDSDVRDRAPVATSPEQPRELSPLAQRALREIPGAVQVSDWEVLLPTPGAGRASGGSEKVPAEYIDAGPVDIGARHYTGVTAFKPGAFPAWLYDGVQDIEMNELGSEEEGYPVGSTEMGIIVDAGPMDLGCMQPLPRWSDGDADTEGGACFPAMLGQAGDSRTYEWGMGTDDFLKEGEGLELFSTDTYTSGAPQTVWIGGTDGTEVATVDLVATDGTVVEAAVAAGTLVPGETMFWGTVTGELAVAVTRSADGEVLERHEVKPCSDPVDCEVR